MAVTSRATRYRVKRGDRPAVIRGTCQDIVDGVPEAVDISDASEVLMILRRRDAGATYLSVEATNLDEGDEATRGRWEYEWGATDLDVAGTYNLEVQVTWEAGMRLTFPTVGHNELIIEPDLG